MFQLTIFVKGILAQVFFLLSAVIFIWSALDMMRRKTSATAMTATVEIMVIKAVIVMMRMRMTMMMVVI